MQGRRRSDRGRCRRVGLSRRPAERPKNSRLDTTKLRETFEACALPHRGRPASIACWPKSPPDGDVDPSPETPSASSPAPIRRPARPSRRPLRAPTPDNTFADRTKPPTHDHDDPTRPQRHHPRGRLRHAAAPGHAGNEQAVAAGLRQADGLLSAFDADAGRHQGHSADQHAAVGRAALRVAARRRLEVGHRHQLLRAAPGSPDGLAQAFILGKRFRPAAVRARSSSGTTSSTATT